MHSVIPVRRADGVPEMKLQGWRGMSSEPCGRRISHVAVARAGLELTALHPLSSSIALTSQLRKYISGQVLLHALCVEFVFCRPDRAVVKFLRLSAVTVGHVLHAI